MGLLQSEGLTRLLDYGEQTHAVIANNLANVNAPGLRMLRLRFTRQLDALRDAASLAPGHAVRSAPSQGDLGVQARGTIASTGPCARRHDLLREHDWLAAEGVWNEAS